MPSTHLADSIAVLSREHPGRVALSSHRRTVTYEELGARSRGLRARLGRLELPAGGTVCVPAHKTPETIALLLAVFQEGLIALAPSPDLGIAARTRLAQQARASHTLTVSADGALTAEAVEGSEAEAEGFDRADATRTRLLLTTSGSTGTPKIVPIPAAGFDAFADWATAEFALTRDDVALSYAPLNFDLALLDVWTFLGLGAHVVLVDKDRATEAAYLHDLVAGHGATFVQGVPMLHRLLVEDGPVFPTVRHLVTTGDALAPELLRPMATAFPNARFHNVFGCTETNDSFLHPIDPEAAAAPPIGRPLAGVTALVLDADGQLVTGAGTGELLVSTPFQAAGYLRSALNEQAFTVRDGRLYYRTGDIVSRTDEGLFTLQGRADWQVKVRGVRTNLQEVETVVASHPDVAEAVVVALPDERTGVRLHAHVTRHPATALTGLRLRTHVGRHLPRHAIPSSVHVTEAPIPRTSTGKPDRNLIRNNRMKENETA
ncbi:AMP-binding protein [Streptomyces sp. P9(2023)]|uniref:AMP-binding protein n=1 Tax=Streptomyces sp. P9(2023) TaxID=3064394 RepID=UPI0028F41215|nr:AMP-binding protein [Streptomyces sp. P9(2023)]MDT9690267.1 AMP-binding protein [Streptomyces sp. P9(2023)]